MLGEERRKEGVAILQEEKVRVKGCENVDAVGKRQVWQEQLGVGEEKWTRGKRATTAPGDGRFSTGEEHEHAGYSALAGARTAIHSTFVVKLVVHSAPWSFAAD